MKKPIRQNPEIRANDRTLRSQSGITHRIQHKIPSKYCRARSAKVARLSRAQFKGHSAAARARQGCSHCSQHGALPLHTRRALLVTSVPYPYSAPPTASLSPVLAADLCPGPRSVSSAHRFYRRRGASWGATTQWRPVAKALCVPASAPLNPNAATQWNCAQRRYHGHKVVRSGPNSE